MSRLKASLLAALCLTACGPSQAGTRLRKQDLPPQVAAQDYARYAPGISAQPSSVAQLNELTPAPNVPGDPNAGRRLFIERGCGGCHAIRGLAGADGVAGPRLDNTVVRPTIGGNEIPTSPQNLAHWIQDPVSLKPNTTMPKPGVSEADARDIAAFLYSLPENP